MDIEQKPWLATITDHEGWQINNHTFSDYQEARNFVQEHLDQQVGYQGKVQHLDSGIIEDIY